jgi:hypothetical protein
MLPPTTIIASKTYSSISSPGQENEQKKIDKLLWYGHCTLMVIYKCRMEHLLWCYWYTTGYPDDNIIAPEDPQLPYTCNVHLFASSMAVLSYILFKLSQSCLYTNAARILNSNTPNNFTSRPPSMKH